ncbi:TNF receptor-associated factor 2-like [Branchiostoma floridae]|uniref:TNF receptor-associated factor 2-like n=1 Tax=Branchiostoma floridae TaxID=7739 RepID=A0A9J7HTR1_BRAFL|nr:TNF receptor-associated factor 2-like [Branchiostoma floridae]
MERGGSDDEGRSGDTPEESRGSPNGQDDNNVLGAQRLRHRVNHLSYLIDTLLHSLAHQSDCREREARLGFVRNELHQLQRIYNDLCNTHAALDNRTREILDTMCEQLFRKLPSIVQQLATCENRRRRDKEKIKELQNRLRSNERILARHETALEERDSRLSTLEFGSYDGKLTWKIDDFKHRRQNAISGKDIKIDSPNFYTSRYGYKMFARIYLDGDGEGKGTHISVFLVIVKGDYDQLLTWPFRQKITFECVDQNGGSGVMESYRPDVASAAFKRPTNTANIASGCPLFVPLSELKNTHRALVKDDTMFMKVTVDVSNLN